MTGRVAAPGTSSRCLLRSVDPNPQDQGQPQGQGLEGAPHFGGGRFLVGGLVVPESVRYPEALFAEQPDELFDLSAEHC
jgi:hypothetical protein